MAMFSARGSDEFEGDVESVTSESTVQLVACFKEERLIPCDVNQSSTAIESEELVEPVELFTYFPKLPAEIRLKIWKDALPGPRIARIYLKLDPRQPRKEGEKKKAQVSRLVSSHPPPVGLRVCRESRIEALKKYELAFPTKTSPAQTYINFDVDTIIMDRLSSYFPHTYRQALENPSKYKKKKVILHQEFSKIRYLVVDELFIWSQRLLSSTNFPCLATINVISCKGYSPTLQRDHYDLEACDRPDPHEASNIISAQWVDKWFDGMEYLAKKAGVNHQPPKIQFVRLIHGTALDTNGKVLEETLAAKECEVQGVDKCAQRQTTLGEKMENENVYTEE